MTSTTRQISGFLSYVRDDDAHEAGRITELKRRLEAEIRMQTGEAFSIFQDRDDIFVGEQWRNRIENSIDETSLLVAIITPSFLRSENCREEIRLFMDREHQLGRDDLIIPILYVHTPGLNNAEDNTAALLFSRQHFDWTDLRFEDFESNNVRREIRDLALHVVEAMHRSKTSVKGSIKPDSQPDDDGPGFLELQAEAEVALEGLVITINSMTQTTEKITENTRQATDAINRANSSGKPASARLSTVQKLSQSLEEPAYEMEDLTDVYLDQLARVGGGVYLLVEQVQFMVDDDMEAVDSLILSVRQMRDTTVEGIDLLQGYQAALVRAYPISRSLKPVLKRIHNALEKVISSRPTYVAWYEDLADAREQRSQA